jgi:hypothetical protein
MPASEFYSLTLAELFDAINGFNKARKTDLDWMLWATRKQIAYALAIGGKQDVREEDIYPLDLDDQLREQRIKNLEPIKVTEHGNSE